MSKTVWALDPAHTQIEFAVKHMMFTTVRGRFSSFEGEVRLDEARPDDSSVEVTIEVESIDTGVAQRDAHLRSGDFFDVATFPQMRFRSTRVDGSLADDSPLTVTGELTIRDVTREIVLEGTYDGTGTDPWGGTRSGFTAHAVIDRRDFGLTWNQALEAGGVLVGNDVKISLQVQAVLQVEEAAATR